MTPSRIRIGLAVGFLGLALSTGTAAAQANDCPYPFVNCTTTEGDEIGTGEENLPRGDGDVDGALGAVEGPEVGQSETAGAPAQAAPSGTLPFTGNDVKGLVVLGAAAVGAGALLVRRSRAAA